jgi:hypothetical protein
MFQMMFFQLYLALVLSADPDIDRSVLEADGLLSTKQHRVGGPHVPPPFVPPICVSHEPSLRPEELTFSSFANALAYWRQFFDCPWHSTMLVSLSSTSPPDPNRFCGLNIKQKSFPHCNAALGVE